MNDEHRIDQLEYLLAQALRYLEHAEVEKIPFVLSPGNLVRSIRKVLGPVKSERRMSDVPRQSNVRQNPPLVIFGNPPKGATLIGVDVQCVIYKHKKMGFRAHGFADADIGLKGNTDKLTITGMAEATGVKMWGLPDGRVLLTGE